MDSLHDQTLVIKQLIPAKETQESFVRSFGPLEFQELLNCSKLILPENISLEALRVLAKNSVTPNNEPQSYLSLMDSACQYVEEFKNNEDGTNQEINVITEWVLQCLKETYPSSEVKTVQYKRPPELGIL